MTERHVLLALRSRLAGLELSYRGLFWVTGVLAFASAGVHLLLSGT